MSSFTLWTKKDTSDAAKDGWRLAIVKDLDGIRLSPKPVKPGIGFKSTDEGLVEYLIATAFTGQESNRSGLCRRAIALLLRYNTTAAPFADLFHPDAYPVE